MPPRISAAAFHIYLGGRQFLALLLPCHNPVPKRPLVLYRKDVEPRCLKGNFPHPLGFHSYLSLNASPSYVCLMMSSSYFQLDNLNHHLKSQMTEAELIVSFKSTFPIILPYIYGWTTNLLLTQAQIISHL